MRKKFSFWQSLAFHKRWFVIGIGIKRWLLLLGLGAAVAGMGLVYFILVLYREKLMSHRVYDILTLQFLPVGLRIFLPALVGGCLILIAVVRIGSTLVAPFRSDDEHVVESLYEFRRRGRGPHIVAIGGGTGMPALLRGLREYTRNITAIVTVADDGGSSGRLRRELGVLPPGDFRNNMAALSRDEALMTQVLQYRFGKGVVDDGAGNGRSELQGHAFGNLLLAALTGIMGSFDEALLAAERVLAVRGRVLPSTLEQVTLVADVAVTDSGDITRRVVGESAIPEAGGKIDRVLLDPQDARAYPPALQAIFQADLIVLGPGSLYTSILPNLLVQDLAKALQRSRALKVYVCNLATQPGETDNYTVADHVNTILQHTPARVLDVVLANDNLSIPTQTGGGHTVYVQPVAPAQVKMMTTDLVDRDHPWRHDSAKLAASIVGLLG
ncbi:MAG: YvcK family protein [Ardenticatenaceae bacterium]|nr:YvcK family protein [Anaerolineales bacterium]MCB8922720.1 YvcK family protein [Ardenticatenaceae bacterium]MCB9003575.1 YvcK family protein [Ardenticatenaceae bacterium]